jgi:hypothetical protein
MGWLIPHFGNGASGVEAYSDAEEGCDRVSTPSIGLAMPIHQTTNNEEPVRREYALRGERWNRTGLGYEEVRS